jgi:hypothetical protein
MKKLADDNVRKKGKSKSDKEGYLKTMKMGDRNKIREKSSKISINVTVEPSREPVRHCLG